MFEQNLLLHNENNTEKIDPKKKPNDNEQAKERKTKTGVKIIGMREEPRVAEQQFGNFREYRSLSISSHMVKSAIPNV